MVQHFLRSLVPCARVAALLGAALTAAAQTPSDSAAKGSADTAIGSARRDPLDPKAIVPKVSYNSAFTQYRGLGDDKPISWREANDTVTRIGGWRVYAREAQQPDSTPAPTPAPATKPVEQAPAAPPTDRAKSLPAAPTGPAGHPGHTGPKTP